MASIARFDQWQDSAGNARQTPIQIVQYYNTTPSSVSSTAGQTYTVWGSLSITPKFSTSKILICISLAFGRVNMNGGMKLLRNGSTFMPNLDNAYSGGSSAYTGAFNTADDSITTNQDYSISPYTLNWMDSPATTSAVTYSVSWYAGAAGSYTLNRQVTDNGGRAISTCQLIEIAG